MYLLLCFFSALIGGAGCRRVCYQPGLPCPTLFCYQFDIYFYRGPINEASPEDMEEKTNLTSCN